MPSYYNFSNLSIVLQHSGRSRLIMSQLRASGDGQAGPPVDAHTRHTCRVAEPLLGHCRYSKRSLSLGACGFWKGGGNYVIARFPPPSVAIAQSRQVSRQRWPQRLPSSKYPSMQSVHIRAICIQKSRKKNPGPPSEKRGVGGGGGGCGGCPNPPPPPPGPLCKHNDPNLSTPFNFLGCGPNMFTSRKVQACSLHSPPHRQHVRGPAAQRTTSPDHKNKVPKQKLYRRNRRSILEAKAGRPAFEVTFELLHVVLRECRKKTARKERRSGYIENACQTWGHFHNHGTSKI